MSLTFLPLAPIAVPIPALTVTITPELLREGHPRNAEHCPIALAVRARIPGAEHVYVLPTSVRWRVGGRWYTAALPINVTGFISDYDRFVSQRTARQWWADLPLYALPAFLLEPEPFDPRSIP